MLHVEIDPAEAGFAADRLARIDRHYQRYVDEGKLSGFLAVIARDGRLVHVAKGGLRDVEAGTPVEDDTVFRIYSMTKPITSVAAMMLWEEGAFELKDPVERFIPAFADARVWAGGSQQKPMTVPAREPVRMWHLLTHTSGLTYGFHYAEPLDGIYRDHGYEFGAPQGVDLAKATDVFASLPLLFEPGTEFNYSVSTDVLGRVVEVLSGQPLDVFFKQRIFDPLGMPDTAFGDADPKRLAALYRPGLVREDRMGQLGLRTPDFLSGGGGLVSTAADYHRFTSMLLGGGELDGTRLLGPRTLRLMGRNHLPGGAELKAVARPTISETQNDGMGFGLGFSVVLDQARTKTAGTAGELAWGGLASTAFWVDPAERVTAQFFTQLIPSSTYPLRSQLRQLTYQALVD
ncbi:beta-lactamase family protein [Solirubrobacter ginsenosidimutans]|uniref:Beta-lactamase family protein n=1 Tax=Solirubrobacter ginsenosidimutans TaxID=490573 RepID=A0A9X3SB26_9ACTN|nr:serine hydrolase domain-containing protein [Solirubrobacter ginsenosidimutans]MDA0166573.1 beta-lactamase family protein [Solirubrobacter ginsenosidimutans]